MEVQIQIVIDTYKEEIARLTNENILLRAQVKQLQNELKGVNNE
jgi:cell division protein FtsB